jgi:hypothetical protein
LESLKNSPREKVFSPTKCGSSPKKMAFYYLQ